MVLPFNVDCDGVAKTVLAGYYKYGVQTLLTGNFGTTGTIVVEYEDDDSGWIQQQDIRGGYHRNDSAAE